MSDLIDRQSVIDIVEFECGEWIGLARTIAEGIKQLPSAESEPAIQLQWIEAQIEWLKSLDNAFSTLTAAQISAMVNKWKDEQDG